jgi:hypothetical protein
MGLSRKDYALLDKILPEGDKVTGGMDENTDKYKLAFGGAEDGPP